MLSNSRHVLRTRAVWQVIARQDACLAKEKEDCGAGGEPIRKLRINLK